MAGELKLLEGHFVGNFQGNLEAEGEQNCVKGSRYEGKEDLNKCYCEQVFISFMYSKNTAKNEG